MNLAQPLQTCIPGEAVPFIKSVHDKSWSSTSLPWMSIGYELTISPLQTLTFYNSIANNGIMVRPLFVKTIKNRGKILRSIQTEIINPSVCSKSTILKAKKMMEGVVQNGTGKALKNDNYTIAGKTGTAQQARKGSYKVDSKITYQASFVGYFPSNNPKYSCIVIVSAPTGDAYYGGIVAGPVFKDVADKVYSTSLELHTPINEAKNYEPLISPSSKIAMAADIVSVYSNLGLRNKANIQENILQTPIIRKVNTNLTFGAENSQIIMPNLIGLNIKDVCSLLDNQGIRFQFSGTGQVISQSMAAGNVVEKNSTVLLKLL